MRKKESLGLLWGGDFPIPQQFNPPDPNHNEDSFALLKEAWFALVGPQTAKNARPYGYSNGTLLVRVRNPIWRRELALHKGKLLQELNHHLDRHLVFEIKLEQGILPPLPIKEEDTPAPSWKTHELTSAMREEIEQKLAHLPENDLKQSARRIMEQHYKLHRLDAEKAV
jgi:hypothetical protein